jgi:hypothetical protein
MGIEMFKVQVKMMMCLILVASTMEVAMASTENCPEVKKQDYQCLDLRVGNEYWQTTVEMILNGDHMEYSEHSAEDVGGYIAHFSASDEGFDNGSGNAKCMLEGGVKAVKITYSKIKTAFEYYVSADGTLHIDFFNAANARIHYLSCQP